jgi:hypothetical protein
MTAAVVAAVTFPALPAGAAERPPAVTLKLSSPYNVTVPQGAWVPVEVTVTNNSQAAVDGHVVVTSPVQTVAGGSISACVYTGRSTVCTGGGWAGSGIQVFMPYGVSGGSSATKQLVDEQPLDLAPGTTKYLGVYVSAQSAQPTIAAEVLGRSGSALAKGKLELAVAPSSTGPTVLVLSDDPAAYSLPVAMPAMLARPQVQVLVPTELPTTSAALGAFSAVVIDRADTSVLSGAQGEALKGYVEAGGILFVAGGLGWRSTVAGLPLGLLPARVEGSATLRLRSLARLLGVTPLASSAQVSTLSPRRGAVTTLSEGARPLAVQEAVGEGQVVFCAVDPAAPPFADWAGTPQLLARLLAPAFQDDYYGQGPIFTWGGASGKVTVPASLLGKFGVTGSPSFTDPAQASADFTAYLEQMPGASLPSAHLLGLLLLGYVIVAGPVCFAVLAGWRRRQLAWVVVPALAAVAALAAWGSGAGMDRAPLLDEVRVDQLVPGSPQAQVLSLGAVYLPRGGSRQVPLDGGGLVTALGAVGGGQLTVSPGEVPGDNQLQVSGSNNSLGGWAAIQDARLNGAVGVSAHLMGNTISGTVSDHLPVRLTSAYVVSLTGGSEGLGPLEPGSKARFNISAQATGPASPPNYILGPAFLGNGDYRAGSPGARHQALLQGLYALATTYSGEHGGAPVLIAVAGGPLGGQGAAGPGPDASRQVDVLMLPLEPVPSGGGRGLLPVLVGSSGVVDQNAGGFDGASSLSVSAGGSLDFHYAVPGGPGPARPGLRVNLGSASADGSTIGLAREGSQRVPVHTGDFTLSAFDYRTGRWTDVGVRASQGRLIADLHSPEPFVGPGGAVELRLAAVRALQIYGATPTLSVFP